MASPEEDRLRNETSQLERENQTFLQAKYEGDVGVFRAKANLLLQKYPVDTKNKWLYFRLEDWQTSTVQTVQPEARDLVMIFHSMKINTNAGPQVRQLIRMVQSETYRMPYGLEFLTTDVTIDHDDDAQYVIDSVPFVEGEGLGNANVPFFTYDGEKLCVSTDMHMFTSLVKVEYIVNGKEEEVMPFGHYESIYDRIDALAVANTMLTLAQANEPVATSAGRL